MQTVRKRSGRPLSCIINILHFASFYFIWNPNGFTVKLKGLFSAAIQILICSEGPLTHVGWKTRIDEVTFQEEETVSIITTFSKCFLRGLNSSIRYLPLTEEKGPSILLFLLAKSSHKPVLHPREEILQLLMASCRLVRFRLLQRTIFVDTWHLLHNQWLAVPGVGLEPNARVRSGADRP